MGKKIREWSGSLGCGFGDDGGSGVDGVGDDGCGVGDGVGDIWLSEKIRKGLRRQVYYSTAKSLGASSQTSLKIKDGK